MERLQQRLEHGDLIVLDGGMGTELQRRGVPPHSQVWSAGGLLTHPTTVQAIHEDYLQAGADIIITNTFATARHVLDAAGLGDRTAEINTLAVQLARRARDSVSADRPIYIAGSISTVRDAIPFKHTEGNRLGRGTANEQIPAAKSKANYREQAQLLAEAGVDLIMLEMMVDRERAGYAISAALETGLPTWIGLSFQREKVHGNLRLWGGAQFDGWFGQMTDVLGNRIPRSSLVSVMHTLTEDVEESLHLIKKEWSGLLGAYGHSGEFAMPQWTFDTSATAQAYLEHARRWVPTGAQVIGGCCGIGPEHISLIRQAL